MTPASTQPPASGLVVVDKPAGITSHDVVAEVRRLAGTRKVGHAGTLDPMATGVLVLGLERATRLLGHLLVTDKVYDATIRLGASTTTDDAEGEVLATSDAGGVSEEAVLTALSELVGEVQQVPSAVSAIKVDGRRAYERVRAGEHVELVPRRVRIDAIELRDLTVVRPDDAAGRSFIDLDVSVQCSSGTYIRAIARDLGVLLGTGGHLTRLRRTAVGPFGVGLARTLDELRHEANGSGRGLVILPIAEVARVAFPSRDLDEDGATHVRHGRKLAVDLGVDGPVAVFAPDGEFLALYEQAAQDGIPWARAVAVFV